MRLSKNQGIPKLQSKSDNGHLFLRSLDEAQEMLERLKRYFNFYKHEARWHNILR